MFSEPLVEQLIIRASSEEGLKVLASTARSVHFCRRPIELVDYRPSGPITSGRLPHPEDYRDSVLVACGTRRMNLCAPCSRIYKGDARELVRIGLRGGKGISSEVSDHPMIFATLTAPSYGAVHRRRPDRVCSPRGDGRCPHGRRISCFKRHEDDDDLVGSPICLECYDYEGAVLFNALSTKLWQRTTIYLRRKLAQLLGVSVTDLASSVRLSYVKVIEFQRRGLIHLHILIRADDPADSALPPSISVSSAQLILALELAASSVAIAREERTFSWGSERDARPVDASYRAAVANYLAKYATKSASDSQGFDRRFKSEDEIGYTQGSTHLKQMALTAFRLGQDDSYCDLNLARWAHDLGHRGHFLTKSRRFSVTFAYLRQIRQAWQEENRAANDLVSDSRFTNPLYFASQGWRFACDAYLVGRAFAEQMESRRLGKEET